MVLADVSDVAAFLRVTIDDSSEPSSTTVEDWLDSAQAEIEHITKQKFESTTVTDEIYDWTTDSASISASAFDAEGALHAPASYTRLKLKKSPVLTVTAVAINENLETDTPNWTTLTEGLGGDYVLRDNFIEFININKFPRKGVGSVRVSYTYGNTESAAFAKKVVVRSTALDYINSTGYNSASSGGGSIRAGDIEISEDSDRVNKFIAQTQAQIDKYMSLLGVQNYYLI